MAAGGKKLKVRVYGENFKQEKEEKRENFISNGVNALKRILFITWRNKLISGWKLLYEPVCPSITQFVRHLYGCNRFSGWTMVYNYHNFLLQFLPQIMSIYIKELLSYFLPDFLLIFLSVNLNCLSNCLYVYLSDICNNKAENHNISSLLCNNRNFSTIH